ncbi:unnamed protein product [Cylicocyclus nassatus]|uniref:C-type lectin domain-containing protein n=1 Tax=Cylicocyclus nassatus TaxID=53992 RepID=A0AA36GUK7_CYLNA|nr:unnamed protein product [Cylicocyclus nassatus]
MWLDLFLSLALVLKASTYECPYSHYLFGDRCFAFADGKGNQEEGRKQCSDLGYDLVSIHDMINNRYAQQFAHAVLSFTYGFIWIGLYKENEKWKWVDNSTYDFMNWGEGINPAHQCAVMRISDGKWLSADCEMPYQALCSGLANESTTPRTDLPRNTTQAITTQKWTTTGDERTALTTTEEGETKTRTPWTPENPRVLNPAVGVTSRNPYTRDQEFALAETRDLAAEVVCSFIKLTDHRWSRHGYPVNGSTML